MNRSGRKERERERERERETTKKERKEEREYRKRENIALGKRQTNEKGDKENFHSLLRSQCTYTYIRHAKL